MKKALILCAALGLAACSRNPDPEYAPDTDDAAAAPAAAVATPAPAPAPAARLADDEAMRLGREAAALLFAEDMEGLFARFDEGLQAQAQSPESFGQMVSQVFAQTGVEGSMVEEAIEYDPNAPPEATIYRRRGNYLAFGGEMDLFIAFNPEGRIIGVNMRPVQ